MVEQNTQNNSNNLQDTVRTLQEENAKLLQLLRSQGYSVDSSRIPEISSQPTNSVLPINSTNNDLNHKHPRPIRPKPSLSFDLSSSLTFNQRERISNNVLTPSLLINNTNSSVTILSPRRSSVEQQFDNSTRKKSRKSRSKRSSVSSNSTELQSTSTPTVLSNSFAQSISGLIENFDHELLTSNIHIDENHSDISPTIKKSEQLFPSLLTTSSSLMTNNLCTTIVQLQYQSDHLLPDEGIPLTARHLEPSQVSRYSDIFDELVTGIDQDFFKHIEGNLGNYPKPIETNKTSTSFFDVEYFSSNEDQPIITDLSSILQIGEINYHDQSSEMIIDSGCFGKFTHLEEISHEKFFDEIFENFPDERYSSIPTMKSDIQKNSFKIKSSKRTHSS